METPSNAPYAEVAGSSGHGQPSADPAMDWTYADMSKTLCWLSKCRSWLLCYRQYFTL